MAVIKSIILTKKKDAVEQRTAKTHSAEVLWHSRKCPVSRARISDRCGDLQGGCRGRELTCFISCGVYSMVLMIITRSSRSRGMP